MNISCSKFKYIEHENFLLRFIYKSVKNFKGESPVYKLHYLINSFNRRPR